MCIVIDSDDGDHYYRLELFAVAGSDGVARYSAASLKTFTP
jgi:hypothetical protein